MDSYEPRNVLDKGFVRLVDVMGNDNRIVQSARISYGEGTKSVREDKGLIDFLTRHKHTSPLEQVEFTFHIKLPLFVMGQLVRHRTASLNQMSARYSVMKDEFYIPDVVKGQDSNNKQGSSGAVEKQDEALFIIRDHADSAYKDYQRLLEYGVSRETARMILPQNLYTEVYWKQDLHNLFHLLKLRMDSHAQWEIQQYANAIYDIIKPIVPNAVDSWENHVKNAKTISREEQYVLKLLLAGHDKQYAFDRCAEEYSVSKGRLREVKEFINEFLEEG